MAKRKQAAAGLPPVDQIGECILLLRSQKVILDADLAELYGTRTRRLNEQVKRNRNRFPVDFLFQLTAEEKREVVANCDHLERLKYSSRLPFAFTEHGALMVAAVLNTPRAVDVSVYVVHAFQKKPFRSSEDCPRVKNEPEWRLLEPRRENRRHPRESGDPAINHAL